MTSKNGFSAVCMMYRCLRAWPRLLASLPEPAGGGGVIKHVFSGVQLLECSEVVASWNVFRGRPPRGIGAPQVEAFRLTRPGMLCSAANADEAG